MPELAHSMMAAYLLKPLKPGAHGEADGPLMTRYLGWVRTMLSRRGAVVAAVAVSFVAAAGVAMSLSTAFLPAQDKAQSSVTIKLAPGSTLDATAAASRRAAEVLRTLHEVRSVFVSAGTASSGEEGPGGSSSSADVTSATLTVDLVPRGERKLKQSGVEAKMRELLRTIPGTRVMVGGSSALAAFPHRPGDS